jgi:3-hydroxy acid dehydrogenase / malonic semialdehyde reductase
MEKNRPIILISGATSGFGEATAIEFAKNGWNCILTGRRKERLIELSKKLYSDYNSESFNLCFDIQVEEEVVRAVEKIPDSWRKNLKILVNNAGLAVGRNPIQNGISDDWNRMIDTNIKGLLFLSKAIIPILIENEDTHIFNISSIAGKEVYPDGNVYCASKHAVDSLSKSMRIDLLKYGIKVTNIAPGAAETEFSLVRYKGNKSLADSTYKGFEPLLANDIAEVIYFVSTRPKHVCINDLTIMPKNQASATIFQKE